MSRYTNASSVYAMRPDPGRTRHDGSAFESPSLRSQWAPIVRGRWPALIAGAVLVAGGLAVIVMLCVAFGG